MSKTPYMGAIRECSACGKVITWNGRYWFHPGDAQPRHIGMPKPIEQERGKRMAIFYEVDETYGRVFRVVRTQVELSDGAFALFNYTRQKGNKALLEYDDSRLVFAVELVNAGLFTLVDTRGGYYEYDIAYAESM